MFVSSSFCVFAPFSRRKFIHKLRPVFFQLCYGRLHKSSPGLTRLHRALGAGWGGVGETGWKWRIRDKIDCILGDPGAVSRVDKMFVVKVYWTRIAERRFLTGLPRGYFFWGEGAAIHTQATIKPCRQPLHPTEPHVRLKHKLIQNIVPFWKTFVTPKKEYHF